MTVRPTFTGPAAVPPDLTLALSPATTSQASPGAQLLTATPTGGTGSVTYAWTATYVADGTSANALLSGSGATRTITTTAPGQVVQVSVTATDSGSPTAQTATASASVSVAQPASPTLSGPAAQTMDAPGSGSVTFTGATGYPSLSYSATFTAPAGSAATMSGSGLGPYTFTTDVEGAYVVTLTLTDGLGRNAVATGVVSLVSMGAIWTQYLLEEFTTYDAASRSGAGTLALQKAGVTQYTATLSVTAGTASAGIDASGMFLTISSGGGQTSMTITPTIDTAKWQAFQWLIDMPTFSGTSVNGGATLQSSTTCNTGTELFPLIIANNATSGYDFKALERLSGVSQTVGNHAVGAANPGRVCCTLVMRGRQVLALLHDSDTFIPMQSIDDGPYTAAMEVSSADTKFSAYELLLTAPKFGIRLGAASGTVRVRAMRALSATPRSN